MTYGTLHCIVQAIQIIKHATKRIEISKELYTPSRKHQFYLFIMYHYYYYFLTSANVK
jgi:hypothetical protein